MGLGAATPQAEWYLNASWFTIFQQIEWVDLSWNNTAGSVENEGVSFNLINLLYPF